MIAKIGHSRLAAKEGEVMPPARVVIFSDPTVNTPILQQEPLAALDLPFRMLAYTEANSPVILFTTAKFLKRRHGLTDGQALRQYQDAIENLAAAASGGDILDFDTKTLTRGQGMVTLKSSFDFEQTIKRLKAVILAENDTIWFGEIDCHADAAGLGQELPKLTLLLFGAPGPGGKAMAQNPRMGLDAFCQKVLVYQTPIKQIIVVLNEMSFFAGLHQGSATLAHRLIDRRMRATLSGAIENQTWLVPDGG